MPYKDPEKTRLYYQKYYDSQVIDQKFIDNRQELIKILHDVEDEAKLNGYLTQLEELIKVIRRQQIISNLN